ncbi:hypothetical protein AYI69_g5887 [Smittium culicis]|uniref:Uncharacterized protein n=1 Tax=Smittium culicis TaxID=133412 RepID=A0A1R1Y300_9FUNG|nr:hypothetical protein AYI69_g5887 [Smittium culicis]
MSSGTLPFFGLVISLYLFVISSATTVDDNRAPVCDKLKYIGRAAMKLESSKTAFTFSSEHFARHSTKNPDMSI